MIQKEKVHFSYGGQLNLPYRRVETIGRGSFGQVQRVVDPKTNQEFALKRIAKTERQQRQSPIQLRDEVMLQHKNVIKIIERYDSLEYDYLLMELMKGGSLRDRIRERGKVGFSEGEVAILANSLLQGLSFLHRKHIIHRDIKPENILFTKADDFSGVKLADFGLCAFRYDYHQLSKFKGTPAYMAPQVYERVNYNKSIDIWSLGAVLYQMLTKGKRLYQVYQLKNVQKRAKFVFQRQTELSPAANQFLSHFLKADPKARLQPYQLMIQPFIASAFKGRIALPYSDSIQCYEDKMQIIRGLKSVIALRAIIVGKKSSINNSGIKNFIIRQNKGIVERHLQMLRCFQHQKQVKKLNLTQQTPAALKIVDSIINQFCLVGPSPRLRASNTTITVQPIQNQPQEQVLVRQAKSQDCFFQKAGPLEQKSIKSKNHRKLRLVRKQLILNCLKKR